MIRVDDSVIEFWGWQQPPMTVTKRPTRPSALLMTRISPMLYSCCLPAAPSVPRAGLSGAGVVTKGDGPGRGDGVAVGPSPLQGATQSMSSLAQRPPAGSVLSAGFAAAYKKRLTVAGSPGSLEIGSTVRNRAVAASYQRARM